MTHLLDNFREGKRLNTLRIETDPSRNPYTSSKLRITVGYMNSIGQYFESIYETYLALDEIPKKMETAEIRQHGIPRPKFHAYPISVEKMEKELANRNKKRHLCGY